MLDSRGAGDNYFPPEANKVSLLLAQRCGPNVYCLYREQYLQKKSNGTGVSGLHVDPNATKPQKSILTHIYLPLNQVVKGVAVEGNTTPILRLRSLLTFISENETADQFTARVFQKNYAKKLVDKTGADFMLKVV